MGKSVGNLSLIEKVGQMFMIGINGTEVNEDILELIQTYKVGGVIIRENIGGVEQLTKLVNALKSANMGNEVPLFVACSQESGRANMLPTEIRKIPAIKYIADDADKSLVYDTAKLTGNLLNKFGINMNLWPMLDLGGACDGKQLGDRCISNNPTIVSSYGLQMINASKDAGVIPVTKYFPGHSTTKSDSNGFIIPHTSKSISKLEQLDIAPFKYAIENGIESILIGHINVSKVNLFAPASMSYKMVTKLLKRKYQFNGLCIADDICATCIGVQYGIKSSARKAIMAGNDIVVISNGKDAKTVLNDITKQIKHGNIDEQEINLRVQKILDIKEKYNIIDEEKTVPDVNAENENVENLLSRIIK